MSGLPARCELPVVIAMSSRTRLLSQTTGEEIGMDLTLNVYSDSPESTVVAVGGEIDVYSAPKLREKLISLGVLVGGLKRVRAHDGWIDLVCTQGRILRIFRITGLSRVFSIYDSVVDALAAHAQPPAADAADGAEGNASAE